MAREFDKLGVSMGVPAALGFENVSRLGAALQIARRGAGDAAEAANNLNNFSSSWPGTEVQKNFAKFGIDLPRLLKTARERGLDPFLVTLKAIQKATGGRRIQARRALRRHASAKNFIKPMLLYADDYKKLVAEIDSANGVIEGNFTRMMGTTAERWKTIPHPARNDPNAVARRVDRQTLGKWCRMNQNEELAGRLATGLVALGAAAAVFGALSVTLSGVSAVVGGIGTLIAVGKAPAGSLPPPPPRWHLKSPTPARHCDFRHSTPGCCRSGHRGHTQNRAACRRACHPLAWARATDEPHWIGDHCHRRCGLSRLAQLGYGQAALAATWQWLQSAGQIVADALTWAFLNMTPVGQVIQHWDEIKAGAMAVVAEWMSAIPSQIMQIGRDLIDG